MKKLIVTLFAVISFAGLVLAEDKPVASKGDEQIKIAFAELLSATTERGAKVADFSGEKIKDAIQYVEKEAPEILKEYLTFKFIEHSFKGVLWSFIFLTALISIVYVGVKFFKDSGGASIVPALFLIVPLLFVLMDIVIPNFIEAVKIKVAPRVYLIEKGMEIIKN